MNIIQTVIKRLFLFWQVSSLGTIFKLATQDGSVVSKVLQTVTLQLNLCILTAVAWLCSRLISTYDFIGNAFMLFFSFSLFLFSIWFLFLFVTAFSFFIHCRERFGVSNDLSKSSDDLVVGCINCQPHYCERESRQECTRPFSISHTFFSDFGFTSISFLY